MPNMDSLRRLLQMQSPQHVTQDPYMAGRRPDINSGIDEWLPGGDSAEYRGAQLTEGAGTISRPSVMSKTRGVIHGRGSAVTGDQELPGMSHTFSREDMRGSDMAGLKRMLGLKQMEHEQGMQEAQLKGEYDVRGQVAGQEAAMDRLIATQGSINQRSDADRDARESISDQRLKSLEDRQTASNDAAMGRAQYSRETPQAKAPEARGGLLGLLERIMGRGAAAQPTAPTAEAEMPAEDPRAALRRQYGY